MKRRQASEMLIHHPRVLHDLTCLDPYFEPDRVYLWVIRAGKKLAKGKKAREGRHATVDRAKERARGRTTRGQWPYRLASNGTMKMTSNLNRTSPITLGSMYMLSLIAILVASEARVTS